VSGMEQAVHRPVCSVGEREYRLLDVVIAGHLRGRWAEVEDTARRGLACVKRLDNLEEELSDTDVEAAATAWRYERDLLSADDTESWLLERHVAMAHWFGYVHRLVLRRRWSDRLDEIVAAHEVMPLEIEDVLYEEGVCSGALPELAERLAAEAAVDDRVEEESAIARVERPTEPRVRAIVARLPPEVSRLGMYGVPPGVCLERAAVLACMMLSFEGFIDRISALATLEREIEPHRLDWTRLECDSITLSAEGAAREAALVVREDGLPISEAARLANASLARTRDVLEDIEPALRDRLVGAQPGELIGPVPNERGFVLVSVLDRVAPSIADPSIRDRARDLVVTRTIEREVASRVRWHERF
jgi:hypothetical protein